jgi:putative transposase
MGVRTSDKDKLKPTVDQVRQVDETLWPCRDLYNAGLEHRIWAYRTCGVSVTHAHQEAERPNIRAAFPDYAAIHSQVLQDVLSPLDKGYQAFFKRVKAWQTPGFPRFQGAHPLPRLHRPASRQWRATR